MSGIVYQTQCILFYIRCFYYQPATDVCVSYVFYSNIVVTCLTVGAHRHFSMASEYFFCSILQFITIGGIQCLQSGRKEVPGCPNLSQLVNPPFSTPFPYLLHCRILSLQLERCTPPLPCPFVLFLSIFPYFLLEVGPLNTAEGSGSAISSPAVWGRAQCKLNVLHFSLKIWQHLFTNFLENQLSVPVHCLTVKLAQQKWTRQNSKQARLGQII